MAIGTHTTIHNLVWKTVNEQFPVARVSERIKPLPPVAPAYVLKMESKHGKPCKE